MNKATFKAAAFLARSRKPWRSPCCCIYTKIRFRSSLSATATAIEWGADPTASLPSHGLEVLSTPQAESSDSITRATTPKDQKLKRPKRRPRKKQTVEERGEDLSPSIPHATRSVTEDDITSTRLSLLEQDRPLTYQDQVVNGRAFFPELEPAPFPRDTHSSMPYMNRGVKKYSLSKGNSYVMHNDLESFEGLHHNINSTLYRGTLFEYQTQEILKKCLGIYTQRSAGNNDLGIDLRGTWFLPLSASPKPGDMVRHLKVIVQCKMMNAKVGPKFVRELQGSLSYETQPTMAILAISSEFTKQALLPYAKSLWPMALVVIDTENYECQKLMWNRAAEKVMHGLQIATRWTKSEDGEIASRPVLCFDGKVVERLPGPYLNVAETAAEEAEQSTVSSPVDYAIPDWDITRETESLYVVPARYEWEDSDEEEEEDANRTPAQSQHLELLSWTPSMPMQESLIELAPQ